MKRSEIIEDIARYLCGLSEVDYEDWVVSANGDAEDLLNSIERMGMAPPQVEGAYEDGKLLKRYWEEE